jgi:hypothetical protein
MVLTHITTGFPKPNFLVLFSVLSLTIILSIVLSTIVRKMKINKIIVNESTEKETKKFGLGKPVVIWD